MAGMLGFTPQKVDDLIKIYRAADGSESASHHAGVRLPGTD
jgi:hypothetical protein